MTVSIIICTRNRAEHLRATLASIANARIPESWHVELSVVDNGSTDHTATVVKEARLANPNIRYLTEIRPGLSHARNTGLAATSGEIILFTDDDVRVPRNWIGGMCEPILQGEADAVQGGIRIAPHLERPWLTGALRVWVAAVEHPINPPDGLVGANMAFSRSAADRVGGFDPRLGPGASGFFDDTLFGWQLQRAAQRITYRPEISVEHHFQPDRLALPGYLQTARRMAESRALVSTFLESVGRPPSLSALMTQLPGFGWRCLTQGIRYLIKREPDAGFMVRYYYIRLWRACRMCSKRDRRQAT